MRFCKFFIANITLISSLHTNWNKNWFRNHQWAVFSNYQHAKPPERAKIRGSGEAWSKWEILGAKVFLAIMMAHSQGIWFNLRLTSKWPRSLPCCVLSVPSQLDHDEGSTVRIDEEVRNANEPLSSLRCFPPLISLGLYREISGVSP